VTVEPFRRVKPDEAWHECPEIPVVGKDVIELLSSSMYVNPLAIYREYLQNATDSIEAARADGVLDGSAGTVAVHVDARTRSIRIRDDGAGLNDVQFHKRLTTVGSSTKRGTQSRGFRGVGRLAGLGYCQTLTFRSRADGERYVHEMRWNCRKLKTLLQTPEYQGNLAEILREVVAVRDVPESEFPRHFFDVELENIIRHRSDVLLDSVAVAAYLAEVAPVPFAPSFRYRDVIASALKACTQLAEVSLTVNETEVYRPHRDELPSRGGAADSYEGVETFEIPGTNDSLAAVGWVLHHGYRGALPSSSGVGGLRLRSGNMQIGESNLLDFVFPESRFNAWSVGEFHILDRRIIPNGRRDHFETNAPFHDLLNQLAPIARSVAMRCRTSSVLRKWERDFDQLFLNASRNLALLRQNVASDEMIEESRAAFESAIETLQKIAGREQIQPGIRQDMLKRIASLRRRAALPRTYPASIIRLPAADRRAYRACFEVIYECSQDKAEAKSLIDRILRRVARRKR
jgi:molecular chaperone HtpG